MTSIYKINGKDYGGEQLLEDVKFLRGRADRLTKRRKILESGIQYARDPFKELKQKGDFLREQLNYDIGGKFVKSHQIGRVFLERFIDASKPIEDPDYITQTEEAEKRVSAYHLRLILGETGERLAEIRESETRRLRATEPEKTFERHMRALRN